MTPLELPAFMTGTVAGMTVWGVVYASLGGASRSLLKSGVDLEELIGGGICTHVASWLSKHQRRPNAYRTA